MDDATAPATKRDLADARAELKADIAETSAMLRAEMHHQYDDLKETIRDVQTEMLKAFYNYAQPAA